MARVEVHVDVGHRPPAGVEEALEQEVVLDRVEFGDAQAVGDGAPSCRPTTRADPNALFAGMVDEVPHDQEVAGEAHVLDHLQLVGKAIPDLTGQVLAPPLAGALPREMVEVGGIVGKAGRNGEVGQFGFAELDRDVGAFGDPEGVVARLGQVAEQVAHFGSGLQVVLVALELEPLRVTEGGAGLDTEQGVVAFVIGAVHIVGVVGGDDRCAEPTGDLDQLRVGVALRRQPVVLHLDEEVVLAEDLLEPTGLLERALLVAVQEALQNMPAEATGRGDQPVVVPLEQLPVHAGLVVVALEEGQAGQLDEVAVALVGLGQEGEVVVELSATFGVATRVVDTPPASGALQTRVVGHVGLSADHRLDALLVALLVELEGTVHIAVVGNTQGRLAVLHRLGHEFVEPGRTIEHRELGVDVKVGERVAHGR